MLASLEPVDIVLASQASWRSEILKQLNISHRQVNHKYQEPKFEQGSLESFIESISQAKALSLEADFPNSLIIAADQLICLDDIVLYKSGNRDNAIKQLELLNGKQHRLICAVAVLYKKKIVSAVDVAQLQMRHLDSEEIEFYVDYDKPWDCAGSYKIESLGASLFEKISVNDPTTIIGLPSNLLLTILRKLGFSNLIR